MNESATRTDWTVGQLLNWTSDYLRDRGSTEPRLDAEVLLAQARQCQRIELYTDFDQIVDSATRKTFRELVQQRADGRPVAYLVGYREFYSLQFKVTPDVLIPRPETELLIVTLLDVIKNSSGGRASFQIADIGTGSGVIAVCAAKHVPQCHLTAIDINESALDVARTNAAAHQVDQQIKFVQGDLFDSLPAGQTFDFILSNPPYVSSAEFSELPDEVRDHEPQIALLAGPTGTEVIARIIQQASKRLRPAGWLMVEISPMIEKLVCQLMDQQDGLSQIRVVKDLAGLPRICLAEAVG